MGEIYSYKGLKDIHADSLPEYLDICIALALVIDPDETVNRLKNERVKYAFALLEANGISLAALIVSKMDGPSWKSNT